MDNNSNNNVSGIPNVSDIKFEDTPAESFDNLYGNTTNNNVGVNNGVGVAPNPNMVSNTGVGASQSFVQNSGIVNQQPVNNQFQSNVNPQVVQSNVGVANPVNVEPTVMSNVSQSSPVTMQNNIGMTSSSQVVNNPVNVNPIPVQPINNPGVSQQVVQPNVGVNNGVGVQVNSGITQNNLQRTMMTANPVNVNSNGVDLSNIDIDAERMQSIEEQLSKTSQYNPEDLQQEKIVIPTDNQSERNRSGLTFVIVLFIIFGVVIVFLPQIIKLIK